MGVGTGVGSMSTTTDVIYTHKKFKRASAETWENKEASKSTDEAPRQSEERLLPTSSETLLTTTSVPSVSKEPPTVTSTVNFNGHLFEPLSHAVPYKGGEKLMCELCGFVSSKRSLFDEHVCMHARQKTFFCHKCQKTFPLRTQFFQHNCRFPDVSHSKRVSFETSNDSNVNFHCPTTEKNEAPKVTFNRSQSLPYGTNALKSVEKNSQDNIYTSSPSSSVNSKQIYKPKFRAQYSFQETTAPSPAVPILPPSNFNPSRNNNESPSSSSTVSTYHSTITSLSSPFSSQDIALGKSRSALDSRSSKVEEFPSLSKVTSQYSSIWKGIKSPSPELVGQHITNLIVQNQAIVETHNPLWSMKYRRQSSIGTPLPDGEGGTSQKGRKTNETPRSSKSQNPPLRGSSPDSAPSYSEMHRDGSSVSSSSLPRPYFCTQMQSSPPIRASKNISNLSIPTSSQLSKVKTVSVYSPGILSVQYTGNHFNAAPPLKNRNLILMPEPAMESLDLSKSSKVRNDNTGCSLKYSESNTASESRSFNHKYGPQFPFQSNHLLPPMEQAQSLDNMRYSEQEEALDLHKKRPSVELKPSSLASESLASDYRHHPIAKDVNTVHGLSVSPSRFDASPPAKKQKISSTEYFVHERSSYSSVFAPNMKMASKNDYRLMSLDDKYGKPKTNSHHMYGGEVQICDGKETKTLKIDSSQNDSPSLHLCIASKHLGVDLESKESQLPTSVVVTIAKSGLNSGGTMVKVENQNPNGYTTKNVGFKAATGQSNAAPCRNTHPEPLLKLACSLPSGGITLTPTSFPSPQIHYPHLGSNTTHDLSAKSSGVSLHVLQPPVLPASTAIPIPSTTSFGNSGAQHSLLNLTEPPKVYYPDHEQLPLPKSGIHSYPSVISIGGEVLPHVPGMPGPYSQAGVVFKSPSTLIEPLSAILPTLVATTKGMRVISSNLYPPTNGGFSVPASTVMTYSAMNVSPSSVALPTTERSKPKGSTLDVPYPTVDKMLIKTPPVKNVILKPPEIKIQPPPPEGEINSKGKMEDDTSMEKDECENKTAEVSIDDGKTFLMPRKRPNSLIIKPQSLSSKSSLSLIGSTLVSPDTPRPKKSCAQLFLNGSAYTYLNLKVSTKTFFCCIYRPQPMYVLQSTNPKLSMYSNWQIRKTEDPLNISPSEAMSLHVSGLDRDRSYSVAKPKSVELLTTESSYWTTRKKMTSSGTTFKDSSKKETEEMVEKSTEDRYAKERGDSVKFDEKDDENCSSPKRIKIFEGGFKTNEDYTYVRGRGRGRYVCETCGIRCKKPSMLKKHIRTHTDLRPFACKHCSFSFKTKGNLTKHLKSKAHFKRCTEMGIIPVPVTVNESHVNQEALHLQGILDRGKDVSQSMEDDDDDEEEEEDDEDEEEEEDDDEEEEEEEEDDSMDKGRLEHHPITMTSLCLEGKEDTSKVTSVDLSPPSGSRMKGGCDGGMPMDLSIKKHSVITTSANTDPHTGLSSPSAIKENQVLRPSYLPLAREDDTKSSSTTTPIKEHPDDILSPVTESSLMLKSIYSTTLKASSSSLEKRTRPIAEPMKGDSVMLQTYLTERAVLDSAKKRYQYLHMSSDEQGPNGSRNSMVSTMSCDVEVTSYRGNTSKGFASLGIDDPNEFHRTESPLSLTRPHIKSPSKISTSTWQEPSSTSCSDDTVTTESVGSSLSCTVSDTSKSSGSSQTVKSDVSYSSSCSVSKPAIVTPLKLPNALPVSLAGATHSLSSAGSTIITGLRVPGGSNASSTSIEARPGSSGGRKLSKGSYSSSTTAALNTSSVMPTPPANLTVLNSCSGDTKTAFIAPSGVIPSPHNNRLGSDDGKCRCSVCHKEFAKQGQLMLHINIHYIERPHRCESCAISFRTNGHLQKHKRSVSHFNKVNMNMTFGTPSTNNPRPFKCDDCKSAFRIYGHLAKHLRSKLHIMRLECLGKLPFGTYAEIERSGVNLNEIDTSDCENSLESLQTMASKLYEKEPGKLLDWHNQQQMKQREAGERRERTVSNSSTNSEEYPLMDDVESGTPSSASTTKSNEDESGDEDNPMETRSCGDQNSKDNYLTDSPGPSVPPYEIGSGATEGLLGCPKCHQKFLDVKNFEIHHFTEHEQGGGGGGGKELEEQCRQGGNESIAQHVQLSQSPHDSSSSSTNL